MLIYRSSRKGLDVGCLVYAVEAFLNKPILVIFLGHVSVFPYSDRMAYAER